MKKYYSLILGLLILSASPFRANAQSDDHLSCGTDQARQKLIEQHPEILNIEKGLEEYTQRYVKDYLAGAKKGSRSGSDGSTMPTHIILPIVFHVIEQGGPENVPDALIYDEVRILNRDYNKQNADTSAVIPSFKSIIADMDIEFRLPSLDPNGNCTNGIDRIYSVQTFSGNDYSKLNTWPREKYINIWLVSSLGGNAAGYAYYPSAVSAVYNTPSQDGVIILYSYIGSISPGAVLRSRALTHEIGHCFNLKHCWGDTNNPGVSCGDDDVDDTPITKGWQSCPSPQNAAVCNPPIIENYQNYMEYSYCSVMFTEGQKARARAALDTNIAGRNNLWVDSNLVATGVLDTAARPCAPKADFYTSTRYVCLDGFVTLTDNSGNATPDSLIWEIPNGAPATSNDKSVKVQFLQPGWQTIKLSVRNAYTPADSFSVKSDSFKVYVGYDNTLFQAPYYEGFDDPNVFSDPSGWASVNYDENNTFFAQSTVNHTGSGSAKLNNYFARADHDIDEIISPAIDMTTLTQNQMGLSFFYSWASGNGNFNSGADSLLVYASTDCGVTWNSLYRSKSDGSDVLGYWQGEWVPTSESGVWKKITIPMSTTTLYNKYHVSNVRFKVQVFSSVGGNDFYIDDINIGSSATAVEDVSALTDVTVFPNPSNGQVNLTLQLATASKVTVKILDITGKEVMTAYEGQVNEGETQYQFNENATLAKGVYIINILAGNSSIQKKLVIQ